MPYSTTFKAARKLPDVTNFWKYLASDPGLLKRTWEESKRVMAPGAVDRLTKEMVYLAVSVTNGAHTESRRTPRWRARPE